MNKFENLQNFKKRINLNVYSEQNYLLNNEPNIFIANHNCLMDIFYLPAAIDLPTVNLISPRLIYKREIKSRYEMVNNLIYSMPIEAHGGINYTNICLDKAVKLLKSNISLIIFPEGAYIEPSKKIYRGRTGAARILYNSINDKVKPNFIPVAIEIVSNDLDLDCYQMPEYSVNIYILSAIDYEKYYHMYMNSTNFNRQNIALHGVMDEAMEKIAKRLNKMYSLTYIELFKKSNVIFEDGTIVDVKEAQKSYYLNLYEEELNKRLDTIISTLSFI